MRKRSRTKPTERKHPVYVNLKVPELTKAGGGHELCICARGEKLGEVDSDASASTGRAATTNRRRRVSWTDFAAKMNELAYG
jgi:hypothetical protein